MTRYEPGDVARLTVTITNVDNEPGDATGLTFTMNPPSGAAVVAYVYGTNDELVKDVVGSYYVDWLITLPGTHRYQWLANGTNASVAEGSFIAHALRVIAATP